MVYALAGGDVADLLRAARRILTGLISEQHALLAELRAAADGSRADGPRADGPPGDGPPGDG